jgi:hypothetical protein
MAINVLPKTKTPKGEHAMRTRRVLDIISILHILDRDLFPRAKSQSQVVQSTGNSHKQISKTFEPVSAFVFNNSVPFDAAYNMLDSDSYS